MTQSSTKFRHWKWAIPLAIITGLSLFTLFFPWNWLRSPIENVITGKTGRAFIIAGDLDVALSLAPRIRMQEVRFDNAAWAHDPQMITAKEAELTIDLRELLRGRLVFPKVRLAQPVVSLERARDGQRNWILKETDDGTAAAPEVRQLTIDQGVIRYRDVVIGADLKVDVTMRSDTSEERPTRIMFSGKYLGRALAGEARAGPVLSLQNTSEPFPMWIRLRMGETVVEADGSFTDIAHFSTVDAQLKIRGPDWSRLYPVIPLPLPSSPPYSFEGRFRREGDQYIYENFTGRVGGSDISGNATYLYRERRPLLKANLSSRLLDLKDLGPIIGIKSAAKGADTKPRAADPKRRPSANAAREGGPAEGTAGNAVRVLPHDPFKLDRIQVIDASVSLNARQFRRPDALPLENIGAQLTLDGGVLKLAPLNFGFAGGQIRSAITLDARQNPIKSDATINLRKARVDQLFPTVELMKDSAGLLGAHLKLKGTGNSIASMLSSASGEMGFAISGGELSNLLVEILGLDGGEIIKFLVGGDQKTAIRCGVASFKVSDGIATSEAFVFDTDDTHIGGGGSINLKDETLSLRLSPRPKDVSILSARTPIRLHGPFSSPSVSLEKGRLATRAGAAVLLGLINPFAALIPLIETGPGKNADCAELLQRVDKARGQAGIRPE
jgi:uncharacterized protein involved in outer membrane biogenesis